MLLNILKRVKDEFLWRLFLDYSDELKYAADTILRLTKSLHVQRAVIAIARNQREEAWEKCDEVSALLRQATSLQFGDVIVYRDSPSQDGWNVYKIGDRVERAAYDLKDAIARAKELSIADRPVPQGL